MQLGQKTSSRRRTRPGVQHRMKAPEEAHEEKLFNVVLGFKTLFTVLLGLKILVTVLLWFKTLFTVVV